MIYWRIVSGWVAINAALVATLVIGRRNRTPNALAAIVGCAIAFGMLATFAVVGAR
jgi:hypothetical protein